MTNKFNPKDAPNCQECGGKSVLRDAGSCSHVYYWYCTRCKIEVKEKIKESDFTEYFLDEFGEINTCDLSAINIIDRRLKGE